MNEVTIVEVSPRDGLQNEGTILSTDAKVELITRLVDAGARRIEAVSFAHPRLVPTMADAEAVMERVAAPRRRLLRRADPQPQGPGPRRRRGRRRGQRGGVRQRHVQRPQPERHGGRGDDDGGGRRRRRADRGLFTTITLATAFGCPFEGEVDPARVAEFARRCADSGRAGAVPGRHRRRRGTEPGHGPDGRGCATWSATRWRCGSTSTTPATPASPTPTPPSPRAWTCWTRARAASAAARSPRRRRATSPPTTSSTCSNGWAARPGST